MYNPHEYDDGFADNLTTFEKNEAAKIILDVQNREIKKIRRRTVMLCIPYLLVVLCFGFVLFSIIKNPSIYENLREADNSDRDVPFISTCIIYIIGAVTMGASLIITEVQSRSKWYTYRVSRAKIISTEPYRITDSRYEGVTCFTNTVTLNVSENNVINITVTEDELEKLKRLDSVILINFNAVSAGVTKTQDDIYAYGKNNRTKFHLVFSDINSI